ncbi:hypothetical protein ROBYS_35210 [Roseobacter sp. OBYS 0001]|nr:hypothetical protein ROBYS_35210 [Roseobacter sp. OBYS 0001]
MIAKAAWTFIIFFPSLALDEVCRGIPIANEWSAHPFYIYTFIEDITFYAYGNEFVVVEEVLNILSILTVSFVFGVVQVF